LSLLGQWDESLAYSARNAQVAERIGEQNRLAWSHFNRARALYGRGDLASALEAARVAFVLAEATGDRRLAAGTRALMSQIETDFAEDEAARADAQTAVASADELGDHFFRCDARYALAYFHAQRAEWGAADDVFKQCAALLEGTDHRKMPLVGGAMAAYVAWQQRRTDEAMTMIGASLELARTATSRHYEAVAYRVRGEMLSEQGLWEEAARTLDEAVRRLDELGSRLELGRALFARGRMQAARGNMGGARADVTRAHATFAETGARRELERAAHYLSTPHD
jgi:tetratricopeptide (TPR) repeat protein